MIKTETILRCKLCNGNLVRLSDKFICNHCSQAYTIESGIVLMEDKDKRTNLRIGDNLLDLHKLRDERKYYDSYIHSDVEYVARLHSVNFSNFHIKLLFPYISNSTIVDLGCGQIPYINSFPDTINTYYGLDLSKESLVIVQQNFKRKFPLVLVHHGIKDTPFHDNSVDIVLSSEVLEHLDDPISYLREINRILKDGGHLSLSTPCVSIYFYPVNLFSMLIKPRFWYKEVNAHRYWKEALSWHPGLQPSILRRWLVKAGFSIELHKSRLWYYGSPPKLVWSFFLFLEKMGVNSSYRMFGKYLELTNRLLASNLPVIKWCGIRQFVLVKKVKGYK